MSTTTVRVSSETHRVLTLLAQQQQESITALLEAAVELYRRQLCLQATNAAYAALRSDPVAWAALQQEQASWEHTVGDGVVDEGTMTNGASTLTRRGLDGQHLAKEAPGLEVKLQPSRGEVWTANLNPIRGHEQAGERPVLIVSTNGFNHGPSDLVIIVPITRTDRRIPMHVAISPPEGGLSAQSYLLCDGVRAIARERLGPRAWGRVSPETMAQVADRLRILLDL